MLKGRNKGLQEAIFPRTSILKVVTTVNQNTMQISSKNYKIFYLLNEWL